MYSYKKTTTDTKEKIKQEFDIVDEKEFRQIFMLFQEEAVPKSIFGVVGMTFVTVIGVVVLIFSAVFGLIRKWSDHEDQKEAYWERMKTEDPEKYAEHEASERYRRQMEDDYLSHNNDALSYYNQHGETTDLW